MIYYIVLTIWKNKKMSNLEDKKMEALNFFKNRQLKTMV